MRAIYLSVPRINAMRGLEIENVQLNHSRNLHLQIPWESRFQMRERPHVIVASLSTRIFEKSRSRSGGILFLVEVHEKFPAPKLQFY